MDIWNGTMWVIVSFPKMILHEDFVMSTFDEITINYLLSKIFFIPLQEEAIVVIANNLKVTHLPKFH